MSYAAGDERVAEIEALFKGKGWHLRFRELPGAWEAWFYLVGVGTELPISVSAGSRLDAAEAAWTRYLEDPMLNRGA